MRLLTLALFLLADRPSWSGMVMIWDSRTRLSICKKRSNAQDYRTERVEQFQI
jgi:hypothetical protein